MFSNRSSLSESRSCRPMMICPSSGADVSAEGEGYDHDDDVTETKRRKSKIELDRIRQLGEKQKIKEKSREREPNGEAGQNDEASKSKIPTKVENRVPPSQVKLVFFLQNLNIFLSVMQNHQNPRKAVPRAKAIQRRRARNQRVKAGVRHVRSESK